MILKLRGNRFPRLVVDEAITTLLNAEVACAAHFVESPLTGRMQDVELLA